MCSLILIKMFSPITHCCVVGGFESPKDTTMLVVHENNSWNSSKNSEAILQNF